MIHKMKSTRILLAIFFCAMCIPSNLFSKNNIRFGGAFIVSDALKLSAETDLMLLHEIRPRVQQGIEISPEIGLNGGKIDIGFTRQQKWESIKIPVLRFSGALSLIRIWRNNFEMADINRTYLGLHVKAYFLFLTLRTGYYINTNETNRSYWSTGIGIGI
jgi:hypothetical protein